MQLAEIVKPFLEQKKLIKKKASKNGKSKLPDIDILKVINTSGFERSGQELVGSHPIFGSSTGTNLKVNPNSNVWYYWHAGDECGGDAWMWLAAECGAIEWSDCKKGALKDAEAIKKTKQYAVDRGLFAEEELFPEKKAVREAYERSMSLMENSNFDPGIIFESENANLLAFLKSNGAGKYQTILDLLKQKDIRITQLDNLVGRVAKAVNKSKGGKSPEEYISPAKQVVDAIKDANHELWHSPDRVSYITIGDSHLMTRAPEFKAYITTSYYEETGNVLSTGSINSVIETLSGFAIRKGSPEHIIYTRIAMIDDKIYVDMANDSNEVIEISKDGGRIRDGTPVRFRRPAGMSPLPYPEKGGNLDELKKYINVPADQWILVKAWIIGKINPIGSYANLVLNGPTGRLKTRTAERLKKILDPSNNKIEDKPKDDEALIIACYDNFVVAFDNVSELSTDLSNKFCMISSGVAFRQRTLYTNMESVQTLLRRPMILNGIEEFVVRGDLIDRSIFIDVPILKEFKTDAEANKNFELAHPKLLGALLDYAVGGLQNKASGKEIKLTSTRMADFAKWVMLCLNDIEGKEFDEAYANNKNSMVKGVAEGNIFITTLTGFMDDPARKDGWSGTASDLLKVMNSRLVSNKDHKPGNWPAKASELSTLLNTLDSQIRSQGLITERGRKGDDKILKITHAS